MKKTVAKSSSAGKTISFLRDERVHDMKVGKGEMIGLWPPCVL